MLTKTPGSGTPPRGGSLPPLVPRARLNFATAVGFCYTQPP